VWHKELTSRLRAELPRWRWKSRLTHRGGTIDGEAQKQNIHIEIRYARGHWLLNASGLFGRQQPQWELTIENGQFTDLDELVTEILAECK